MHFVFSNKKQMLMNLIFIKLKTFYLLNVKMLSFSTVEVET